MKNPSKTWRLLPWLIAIGLMLCSGTQASALFANAELVIKVTDGESIDAILSGYDAMVDQKLPYLDVYLINTTSPTDLEVLADEIAALPEVAFCHPNFLIDPLEPVQSSLPFSDVAGTGSYSDQPASETLNLQTTHQLATGAGTIVGVIDGGVDFSHPAFGGSVVSGYDYVDVDADAFDEPGGINSGHGTFVAGVIHLVAPDAVIRAYRVTDIEGESDGFVVAEAIMQAVADGCDVINLSMVTKDEHLAIAEAIQYARLQDVVVVAAAGNGSAEMAHYPASDVNALAVAAVDSLSILADFSSFGDYVDVCAPGTEIYSPYRDGGYAWWGGTSFSAPFVTAQVALVVDMVPYASWGQIVRAIVGTATNVDDINTEYTGLMGAGLIDPTGSLTSLANFSCADLDENYNISIVDASMFIGYAYFGDETPANPSVEWMDGRAGLTNNDFTTLWSYLFWTFTPPVCSLEFEGDFPVSGDIVQFSNQLAPAGVDSWTVDVWMNSTDDFGGVSIAFEYSCATSELTLDSVDWKVERALGPFYVDFPESSSAVMMFNDMFPTNYDYIQLASVTFSLTPSDQDQMIDIAFADIPDRGLTHTTVLSRIVDDRVVGVAPIIATAAGDPYCDAFGNACFGLTRGNCDGSLDTEVDMGDLTALIDYMFISFDPLPSYGEADVAPLDGPDGVVDMADVTALIDHLFINYPPLPTCDDVASPAPLDAPTRPIGAVEASYENGVTTFTLNSLADIRGLQIQLEGEGTVSVESALDGRLDILAGQQGDAVSIGLVDLNGGERLTAGRTELFSLAGEYEVISVTGSDLNHHSVPLDLASSPTWATCADLDENYNISIVDVSIFIGYAYFGGETPANPSVEWMDGRAGLTNNDFTTLWSYLFWTFTPPVCSLEFEGDFPVSGDIVQFSNQLAPAGVDSWTVDVWMNSTDDFGGVSIAFEYSCATSELTLDTVDWKVERALGPWYVDFPESSSAVMMFNDMFPTNYDYIQLASVTFSLTPSGQDQMIDIAFADIPDRGLTHTTVLSRLIDDRVVGFAPIIATAAGDPYCDAFGNACFGLTRGNCDGSLDTEVDMGDLTALIDYMFISFDPLPSYGEADVAPLDGPDGVVDMADVTALIDHLFINFPPLPTCDDVAAPTKPSDSRATIGSLQVGHVEGRTELVVSTDKDLRGIQIVLEGTGSVDVTSQLEADLDLLVGQNNGQLVIGMVDLDGPELITTGRHQLLSVDGTYEVVSVTVSDRDHRSYAMAVRGAGDPNIPTHFSLDQNYPNPFNPETIIRFAMPVAADVRLDVFNLLGRRVTTLVDGRLEAGYHDIAWDATRVASGVYFYRLETADFTSSRKMILLK